MKIEVGSLRERLKRYKLPNANYQLKKTSDQLSMNNTWLQKSFRDDRFIWLIVFSMALISVLAVYSSVGTLAYKYQQGNTEYYLIKHLIILLFGIGLMYAAHLIRYTHYTGIAQLGILIAIPLLI